jgi:hypothetical protein
MPTAVPPSGLACPTCGCEECTVLTQPRVYETVKEGRAGTPWISPGKAVCGHCSRIFWFSHEASIDAGRDPGVCPKCGGDAPTYKTLGSVQYRKCGCGHTYKTERNGPARG